MHAQTDAPGSRNESDAATGIRRRGLFAAIAGLVAAFVAKPKRLAAASGGGNGGNLVINSTFFSPNLGDTVTVLLPSTANFGSSILMEFVASVNGGTTQNINGLFGQGRGSGSGVIGVTGYPTGFGGSHSLDLVNSGVVGYGNGSAVGVQGISTSNFGVVGRSTSNVGTYGISQTVGTVGLGQGTTGIGVWGETQGASGYALFGRATTAGGVGVWGQANPWAGVFAGGVYINGALTVSGAKSAAVPHPDGSLRRVYCVESPESWFEEFGTGTLVDGKACLMLDPDFAAIVKSDAYHVFLTAEGESNGLYVTNKTPEGFEVREQGGGSSSVPFTYRIVARRKDIEGPRLEKIQAPDFAAADAAHVAAARPLDADAEPAPSASYVRG